MPARSAATGPHLRGDDLSIQLGGFEIDALDIELPRGQITAIVGPNGSGKTTLLRMLSRLLEPETGTVYIDGTALAELSTREVARRMAVLPQSSIPPEGVTVRELAGYGRHPHRGVLDALTDEDADAIAWALEVTDMAPFAERAVDSLSGGERQRAWIAMALAQDTDVLLLDEPTTYLDIRYQVETLSLVRELNRDHGLTVAWVLHDLNQAAAYSDRIALMDEGAIVARGPPDETVTADTIEAVFGIPVTVTRHPSTGTPYVVPATSLPDRPSPAGPEADRTVTP